MIRLWYAYKMCPCCVVICPGSQGNGLSVEAQIENAAAAEDVSARRRSHPWECDSIFGSAGGLGWLLLASINVNAP